MIVTTTECKTLLNITSTIYDTLIASYLSTVESDIFQYTGHRWHDAYHWLYDDGIVFSSTAKTITLSSDSTSSFLSEYFAGDTIDIVNSYHNNRTFSIASITSSHILVVNETAIKNESSTNYDLSTYIYRCNFPDYLKMIASKMIWYLCQNTTTVTGDIASESLGSYSVSYRDNGMSQYGTYPNALISGLKRKVGTW